MSVVYDQSWVVVRRNQPAYHTANLVVSQKREAIGTHHFHPVDLFLHTRRDKRRKEPDKIELVVIPNRYVDIVESQGSIRLHHEDLLEAFGIFYIEA